LGIEVAVDVMRASAHEPINVDLKRVADGNEHICTGEDTAIEQSAALGLRQPELLAEVLNTSSSRSYSAGTPVNGLIQAICEDDGGTHGHLDIVWLGMESKAKEPARINTL
jgi:hypothetical protein